MTHLEMLIRKYREDELFRRLTVGSPTWSEMVAEAIMKDRTGVDHRMTSHGSASIDLVAADGRHVQVKTVGTRGSLAAIRRGRDTAPEIMVIATFGDAPRFFLVPMEAFKERSAIYDYPHRDHYSWEISGSRIAKRVLDAYEITPSVDLRACIVAKGRATAP